MQALARFWPLAAIGSLELACGGARPALHETPRVGGVALVEGIGIDAAGDVFVTGWFEGVALDFDGASMANRGHADIFLAKLDPKGKQLWRKRFGDAEAQAPAGLAVDVRGNVVLVGTFGGAVDFGGGELTSDGLRDALDPRLRNI